MATDMPEEATAVAGLILEFALSHRDIPFMDDRHRAWCWKEKFLHHQKWSAQCLFQRKREGTDRLGVPGTEESIL